MYPSSLFLNNYDKQKNEFTFSMIAQGYLDIKKIEPILVYELENVFRNSGFEDFERLYNKAFYDTSITEKNKQVKWLKPAEFFVGQDSTKKKTLVFINTEWCNGCKVMHRTSFIDTATEKYLKEKFVMVDFNPEIVEPLVLRGQTFTNPRTPQMPFHELAIAFGKNSLTLPTLVILDEKLTVLDAVPFYLNPTVLKNITTYYGDDIYKKKSWNEFMGMSTKP
jgi:thioredoxin-related protein